MECGDRFWVVRVWIGFGGFFFWFSGGGLAAAVEATVWSEVGWWLCRSRQQQGLVPQVAVVARKHPSDDGAVRVVVDCLGCFFMSLL